MTSSTHGPKSIHTLQDLTPDPQNANIGTARGRQALAHSLAEFGAARSIVTDRAGVVIAGNKTLHEARALDLRPRVVRTTGDRLMIVQRLDLDLTRDARARQLAWADNRSSELGLDWDLDALRREVDAGLDLTEFWTAGELEQRFGEGLQTGAGDPDAAFEPRATDIQLGDLFALGPHRLICGDATDRAVVA